MTPPNEHSSEGGRDDRGVPYHAESTLFGAQVLKRDKQTSLTELLQKKLCDCQFPSPVVL